VVFGEMNVIVMLNAEDFDKVLCGIYVVKLLGQV
jgi:hypothetical protein